MTIHLRPQPRAAQFIGTLALPKEPIRAAYFSHQELSELGAAIAEQEDVLLPGWDGFAFPRRVRENAAATLANYRSTSQAAQRQEMITPAAEWILDNYHLIEENGRQVRRDLPLKFYRQLPLTKTRGGSDVPRALAIAWLFIAHTNSSFDVESLTSIVEGYQKKQVLKIGEIWALPAVLRMLLLENLRRLSDRVEKSRNMRAAANAFADELIALGATEGTEALLAQRRALTDDNSFSAQLLYRLRDGARPASNVIAWLEQQLEIRGTDAEEVIIAEHARQSMGNLNVGNIVRSLRRIDDIDWTAWFESVSHVDLALRAGSDFRLLDARTRNTYRNAIERIANRSDKSEIEVALAALELSINKAGEEPGISSRYSNLGFYLLGSGLAQLYISTGYRADISEVVGANFRKTGWLGIAAPLIILTGIFVGFAAWFFAESQTDIATEAMLLVMFAPLAWEAAEGLFQYLAFTVLPPFHLPGYAFKAGVPKSSRTLVVIPCIIDNRDTVDDLLRNLEVHYLANPEAELYFALLSDWPDSRDERNGQDDDILEYAQSETAKLAGKYEHTAARRFFLLHRRRLWNEAEGVWMGWERKRGKLHELNLILRGDHDTTYMPPVDVLPDGVRYVLTLDSDTRLPRDSARALVGKLSHPLNTAGFDPTGSKIISGYAILQPRLTPSLTTGSEASAFQRAFSIDRGIDTYQAAVSDIYQDLLGEGSFTGKGIYDVDAFEAALKRRVLENSVLSHDLLEGSYARAALAGDVEFVEDFPISYDVEVSRQHRWTRGDWQLLPYIFNPLNGLSALARFKIADNLRRSLTPIFWVTGSVVAWSTLPLRIAAAWQIILIISLFVAPTLALVSSIIPKRVDVLLAGHLRAFLKESFEATVQVALRIAFMAHMAFVMADAIIRTLYRLTISRKNLLEWKTARQVTASKVGSARAYYRIMWQSPAIGVSTFALALTSTPDAAAIVGVFALLWIGAPALAWFVSRTAETSDALVLPAKDAQALRAIARRTWRYFECFVTEQSNYLPPDNFQETPAPFIAERTSPTNIGLYLLATISARDFGWIGLSNALERVDQTLATVEKMERYRGHLFNWYDTRTLAVLDPSYVSTVDSGNMAGHLITVAAALRLWAETPTVNLLGDMRGIGDVAFIVQQSLSLVPDDRRTVRPLRRRLEERLEGFHQTYENQMAEPQLAPVRSMNLSLVAAEIVALAADLNEEFAKPQTIELLDWARVLHSTCESHNADAVFDRAHVQELREHLLANAERSRKIAFEMDFSFLLNKERRLLSIGYRAADRELDESCYDLLTSEARLASLFAIAKGDIAHEHWFRLGRPIVAVNWQAALASWSGSMFEYLMPSLVMNERQGGLLSQSNKLAIRNQISYGRDRGVPWGVSESAYNARDRELNYQYRNFGVPALGLKRDLVHDLVIAPYATGLASQFYPSKAVRNFEELRRIGALGSYGYYDSIDYTPSRLPEGEKLAVVRSYMAHHQAMTVTAIANAVHEGLLRNRFHSDPVIEAAELLLQEKVPRELVTVTRSNARDANETGMSQLQEREYRIIRNPAASRRETIVLSNGHYSIMLTANGVGYSRWNGLAVTRWRPDATFDDWGFHVFIRDMKSHDWWSATSGLRPMAGEESFTVFTDEKAEFHKTLGTLTTRLECLVASDFDAEGRRLILSNKGETDRILELTSYSEPVLAFDDTDVSHPAFSKMFVKTEIGPSGDVIYAERNKRAQNDPDMCVAHVVADAAQSVRETQAETDRRAFIGRGRRLADAAAFDRDAVLSGTDGYTLDPCLSLRRTVRVPAGKEIQVIFWMIAAPHRTEIEAAVAHFRHPASFTQEMHLAWTRSQVQMRHTDISPDEAALFQKLAGYLIYPDTSLGAPKGTVPGGARRQSALWPMGISGDYPIFALRVDDEADIAIVRKAFRLQEYLRSRGVVSDLVIVNERASSYAQSLQNLIDMFRENVAQRGLASGPGQHIFSVRRDLMGIESYHALLAAARIVLHTRNGTLSEQLARTERPNSGMRENDSPQSEAGSGQAPALRGPVPGRRKLLAPKGDDLLFWNGYGGFDPNGRDYVIRAAAGVSTPHPWINVVSNQDFGFHISAEGAAYTWSRNSRDYQLTPWTNDAVINRPGEAIYVRDLTTGEVFAPIPALQIGDGAHYETRHAPGQTVISMETSGLTTRLTQVVAPGEPAKLMRLEITDTSGAGRKLRVFAYAEWVLGSNRAKTAPFLECHYDSAAQALTATNPYSTEFSNRVAFLASGWPVQSYTASRTKFFGAIGSIARPEAVAGDAPLDGDTETYGDPCATIACEVILQPGASRAMTFMLGDADNMAQVPGIVSRLRTMEFSSVCDETGANWERTLGTLQVETPDKAFDQMINTWLPYQVLACRIRARSAFYQTSGAFGFRDQLQDAAALLLHDPSIARRQILNAAGRQFAEGDVQHWWLPTTGAGVRTTISDDIVWLAYSTAHYVSVTGDNSVLSEEIAFLTGPLLKEGEHDAFFSPETSDQSGDLFEHCARALDLAVKRTGVNGLPLFLGGDWNDGMNRVGEKGRGESVWLGWFLLDTLHRFISIAEKRKSDKRVASWRAHAKKLNVAIERAGWDGAWYRRGYFDDGAPLGSIASGECRIDSIAQSWSVLSGQSDTRRSAMAMDSVLQQLVDEDAKIVRLFTPPFEHTASDPGYIKGYPPGVRENGGQYTHAAAWVAYALARMGRSDDAWRVFAMLNPINHALTQQDAETYRVEPYVVAADVYGVGGQLGRGGWTWYTGSAGWLYRTAIEAILGIEKRGDRLYIKPSIPSHWNGYKARLVLENRVLDIQVDRAGPHGKFKIEINGNDIGGGGSGYQLKPDDPAT